LIFLKRYYHEKLHGADLDSKAVPPGTSTGFALDKYLLWLASYPHIHPVMRGKSELT